MAPDHVDVAIIGGGPVGLSAAIYLGKLGIRCSLFERNATTSFHPRGHVVNARTMELFRELGVEGAVCEVSLPVERHAGIGFVTSLAGEEIGSIRTRGDAARDRLEISNSCSLKRSCPQDVLEPLLRARAESLSSVDLRFATEITHIVQNADEVTLDWTDKDGHTGATVARYVIAADGARSFIRDALGVGMSGGSMGQQIGVYFKADLWAWIATRPYLLWWIYNAKTTGVLISLDGRHRWTYNFAYGADESRHDYTPERCMEILRAVIGDADVPIDIQNIMPWRMQARLLNDFKAGRVFFAGDAAHPLPPTGGQGVNTGAVDIQNLAWKLNLVLSSKAPESLLDSYDSERRPVAGFNVAQSVRNAEKMAKSGLSGILDSNSDVRTAIDGPRRAETLARLAAAIPAQREHFDYPGQTFGYVYESELITPDGTPPQELTVEHYQPSARPGHRAPHVWLRTAKGRISTIDLFGSSHFTLLTGQGGEAWVEAFDKLTAQLGLEGLACRIGPSLAYEAEDADWLALYGLTENGAVLVRPDGHVAFRAPSLLEAPGKALEAALRRSIGLDRAKPVAIQKAV